MAHCPMLGRWLCIGLRKGSDGGKNVRCHVEGSLKSGAFDDVNMITG